MIDEKFFNAIIQRAKMNKYSSMSYIDFDDCKNSEVLYDSNELILLQDKSKTPAMLYFATDDFDSLIKSVQGISGKLRLHFVPKEYAARLGTIGFIEWAEYADFWNNNLPKTAARFHGLSETEYLSKEDCVEAAKVSQKCSLQSRGFEGESLEWFLEWLKENKVIIQRADSKIIGYCCVSIYNEGTTLWIREIAVDPAYQGSGMAKKIMEKVICYGIENGAIKGFLAADKLNKNAIGLYEKYDFHTNSIDSELQMLKE